jgi:hypothetical protein
MADPAACFIQISYTHGLVSLLINVEQRLQTIFFVLEAGGSRGSLV